MVNYIRVCKTCALLSIIALIFITISSAFATDVTLQAIVTNDETGTLTMTIPSDVITLNLMPSSTSTSFDSIDFPVVVSTTNRLGYTTTISSSSTSLTQTEPSSDGTYATIPTLATLSGGYSESTFRSNRWGVSLDSGTTYVPFVSGMTIMSSSTATDGDTAELTFGAKVDISQKTGTYELTLNFESVINVTTVETITMQSYTTELCAANAANQAVELVDSRDNNTYTVRYIGSHCYMTENLNYDLLSNPNLIPETSNVLTEKTLSPTTIVSNSSSTTEPQAVISSTDDYGGYYNYCAATAGEICEDNSLTATEDICPSGWHLPTRAEFRADLTNDTNTWVTDYDDFIPIAAGYYNSNGALTNATVYGYWWTQDAYSSTMRYYLYYSTSSGLRSDYRSAKGNGYSIRCVAD